MTLAEFTNPNLLVPELLNERQESVVAELSKRLAESGCVKNARVFSCAALQHESIVSSVFDQAAFPLASEHTAAELSFAIGLSQYGILWNKRHTSLVYAVVLSAVPCSSANDYLRLAITFSTVFHNKGFFYALRRCKRPEDMFDLLARVDLRGVKRAR